MLEGNKETSEHRVDDANEPSRAELGLLLLLMLFFHFCLPKLELS